jgi:opacity protein-like surface antigen
MKKLLGLFVLLVLAGLPAKAQDSPVAVGGGYTYRSWGFPGERFNMNGWNATASFNVNNWLTVAADFDGTYTNNTTGTAWFYSYMGGPRIYPIGHGKFSPFVHVLAGGVHSTINFAGGGGSASDTAFGFEGGGGVDVNLTPRFAVRIGEFDYEYSKLFGWASIPVQNNFKYKAAILFKF